MVIRNVFLFILLAIALDARCNELRIGVEDDAAPWSYKDGSGFANDLVTLAYKAVGITVKFDIYPYARCKLQAEKGGKIACLTTSQTPETDINLMFPKNSLINVHNVLFIRKGDGIKDCDNKKWPRPLNVIFTNEYEYVEKFNQLVASGVINPIKTNTESQGLIMLQRKRADAAIINIDEVKTIEYVMVKAGITKNIAVGCELGSMKGYLAFSKKNPSGYDAMVNFDKGFEIIRENGELKKLQSAWAQKAIQRNRQ